MIRNLRRTNLMLIVGVLAILASAVIRPTPSRVSAIRSNVRTPDGLQLASIFEGVTGSQLDITIVHKLVAEAQARPHDPCHKKATGSPAMLLNFFAPSSVFAQSGCNSPCTGHFDTVRNIGGDCPDATVCWYGDIYFYGCQGAEFQCDVGSTCGQTTCVSQD
jgi:hypothetical protein